MKRFYSVLAALCLTAVCHPAFSQMVGDNVFLQGAFVELGIAPNGGYGSTLNAPSGYHPNNPGGDVFFDPAAGTSTSLTSNLGFVADYGADGWTVGTPPYFGDYYLPGTPQEGWAIEINGAESDAYIPSYMFGATGYTGGLSGTNVSYSNTGGIIKGVWLGQDNVAGGGVLQIRQTTVLDTSKLYFTVNVILTNTGTVPLNNIYYFRTVDPDNDETQPGGSFTTDNQITDQLPNPGNKVLVSATGTVYTNAYLGLGTKDSRAKCMIFSSGLTPAFSIDSLYAYSTYVASTGYLYDSGATSVEDVGIGLDYSIGTLLPGQCTYITYAYILNASYIDSALNATESVQFVVNDSAAGSSYTINSCSYPDPTATINLLNATGYTWNWAPDSFIQHTTGTSNILYVDSVTSPITYTITGTNILGGCDSITYYLTVGYLPFNGPQVPPVSYCQYANADTLTAPGTGTKTWYTSPTTPFGSTTAPLPSTTTPGTTIYYVSDSLGYCVSIRSADTVTVVPLPLPPLLSDPSPYCQGQTFVPFTATGTSILWYTGPTGGTGSTTPPVVNTSVPGTYVNYATQTVTYTVPDTTIGCESPRQFISTVVLDSIKPNFNYQLIYGCSSDTVIFTNTTYGGLSYVWNFGDYNIDTAANPTHVYNTQDSFRVILVARNGMCEAADTQIIPIFHYIKAAFGYTSDLICQQTPDTFSNNSQGIGLSYSWTFGNGDATNVPSPVYNYTAAGTYHVSLVVTDFVPCSDTATAIIQVDTQSSVALLLTDTVICQGTYATLSAQYSSVGNTGVTWYLGNGDTIKNDNPISYAYPAPGAYTVSVTAIYRACLDTSTSRSITVLPQPTINLGPDTSICAGSVAITLADYINPPSASTSWLWNTGQTTAAITVNSPGVYYATVNVNNCYASDSVTVSNDCYMDIPNAFTPNKDGVNDYFYPRDVLTKGLVSFKMDIYNRWGELIFETSSLDGAGWDGKLNNTDQPNGVYIYVIDGTFKDGQKEHHQGNVTLIR
jgi:gliding motility-associated-like protein